jgi:hypothetical protein
MTSPMIRATRIPPCRPSALLGAMMATALALFAPASGARGIPLTAVGKVALPNPNALGPESDQFGSSVASGDFNDDGIDDLAVADREHPNLVRVFFGTAWEVGQPVGTTFTMETIAVPMVPGTTLGPSLALAVGDFDHDAHNDDDLVVGVPGDSLSIDNAGAVFAFSRASGGSWSLVATIRQGHDGYIGISEAGDHFGAALAVGDFNHNGLDDLAIGIPGEMTLGEAGSGTAYIVYQGLGGLSPSNAEGFYRGFNGLTGVPHAGEQIGFALAAGDFDGDDATDLAVGIPGATCAGQAGAGSVMILHGTNDIGGLVATPEQYWSQAMAGVAGACNANDRFGSALVAGRFDPTPIGDPETDDLAIGVPGEMIEVPLEGAVNVLFGSVDGITADGSLFLHESLLPGGSAETSAFGARLAAGRINEGAGTRDSLIIGAPFASEYGTNAAGRVWILPSSGGRVSPAQAESRCLTPQYAAWPAGNGDAFGVQLAVGDFNGDSHNDLAVGIPNSDATDANAGIVQVLYQSMFLFVDGFDG